MKKLFVVTILMLAAGFSSMAIDSGKESSSKIKSVSSPALEIRFEKQFNDLFSDVQQIEAHFVEGRGYCYAVYGVNTMNQPVVEYFKTTEEEVKTETYDYITLSAKSLATGFCYEPGSGGEMGANGWCSPKNSGWKCAYNTNRGCRGYF